MSLWFNASEVSKQLDVVDERWNYCRYIKSDLEWALFKGLEELNPELSFMDDNNQLTIKGQDESFEYRLRLQEKDFIDIDWVKVDHTKSPYGTGRIIIRNAANLASLLGFQSAYIDAQNSNGGYAWAKCGFKLIEKATGYDKNVNNRFIDYVSAKIDTMMPYLMGDEQDLLGSHLSAMYQGEDRQYEIAGMDRNILPELERIWMDRHGLESECAYVLEYINNTNRDLTTHVPSDRQVSSFFETMKSENRSIKLGQFLLLGTHWIGALDFSDQVQMKRLENYVDQVSSARTISQGFVYRKLTAC